MKETQTDNQIDALIEVAWLETVKGTWSQSDFKIFANGYRRGYQKARQLLKEEAERALWQ